MEQEKLFESKSNDLAKECNRPSLIRSWLIILTFVVASGLQAFQWLFYLSVPEISKSYYMTDAR